MQNFKSQNTRWGPPSCVPDKMRPHSFYFDSGSATITEDDWFKFDLGGELRGDPKYGPLHIGLSKLCLDLNLQTQVQTAVLTEDFVGITDISFEIANTTADYKGVKRIKINFQITKIEHYVMLPYIIVHAANNYLREQTHLVNGWLVFTSTYTFKIIDAIPPAPVTPTFDYFGYKLTDLWMPKIDYYILGEETLLSEFGFNPTYLDDEPRHKIMISFNQEIGPLFKRKVEGKDISLLEDQFNYIEKNYGSKFASSPAAQFQNFTDTMFPQYYVNYMFLAKNQNNANLLFLLWSSHIDYADDPSQPINKTLYYTQPVTSTTSNVRKNTAFPAIQCRGKMKSNVLEFTKILGNSGSYSDITQWGALGTEVILPEKPFRKLYLKSPAGDFMNVSENNVTGLESSQADRSYNVPIKQKPKVLYFTSKNFVPSSSSWQLIHQDPVPEGENEQKWQLDADRGSWHVYNPDNLLIYNDFSFEVPFEKTNIKFCFRNRARQFFKGVVNNYVYWNQQQTDIHTAGITLANKFGIKFIHDKKNPLTTFYNVDLLDMTGIRLSGESEKMDEDEISFVTYPSGSNRFPKEKGSMTFYNSFRWTTFSPSVDFPNHTFKVLCQWTMKKETEIHPGEAINDFPFYFEFYDALFKPHLMTDYSTIDEKPIDSAQCLLELQNETSIDPHLRQLMLENAKYTIPETYNRYSIKAPWGNAINRNQWIYIYGANNEYCSPSFISRQVYSEQLRYMVSNSMRLLDGPDLFAQTNTIVNKTRNAIPSVSCHYAKYFVPDEALVKKFVSSGQRFFGGSVNGLVSDVDMSAMNHTLFEFNGYYQFENALNLFNEYTTGFAPETPLDFYNSYAGHFPIVTYFGTSKVGGIFPPMSESHFYSSSPDGFTYKKGISAHMYDYEISLTDPVLNGTALYSQAQRVHIGMIDLAPYWIQLNSESYEKYDLNLNHPYKKIANRTLANVNNQRWRSPFCSCLEIGTLLRHPGARINILPETLYTLPIYYKQFNQHTNQMSSGVFDFYSVFRTNENTRLAIPFEYGTNSTNQDASVECRQFENDASFLTTVRTHFDTSGLPTVLRDEAAFGYQLSVGRYIERSHKILQVSKYRLSVPQLKNITVPDTRWLVQPGGSVGTFGIYGGTANATINQNNVAHMTLWCSVAPVYNNPRRIPIIDKHFSQNWVHFKDYSRDGAENTEDFIIARNGTYMPDKLHYKNASLDWLSTTCDPHIYDNKFQYTTTQMEFITNWSSTLGPYSATIFMKPYTEEQNRQFALLGQHLFFGQLVTNISMQYGNIGPAGLERMVNVLGQELPLMYQRPSAKPSLEAFDTDLGSLYETSPATMGWSQTTPRCTIFHPGKLTPDMAAMGITDEKHFRVQRCPPNILIPIKAAVLNPNLSNTAESAIDPRITITPPSESDMADIFKITPNSIDNVEKLYPVHFRVDNFENRYAVETETCLLWLNYIDGMSTRKTAFTNLIGVNKDVRAVVGTETSHIYSVNVCTKEVSNEYYSNIPIIYQIYTRGVITTTTDLLKFNHTVINVLWQGSSSVFEVIENDIQNVEFFPLTGKTGHSTGGTLQQFHFAVFLDDTLIKPKDISKFACVVNVMQNNPNTGDITSFNGLPLNEFY